jgi:hypothetical protein
MEAGDAESGRFIADGSGRNVANTQANLGRGTRMCMIVGFILIVILVVLVIGFAVLAIDNTRHNRFESMMPDWLSARVAEYMTGKNRYVFRQVVDSVTLVPIANNLALLYGAAQGAGPISIAKGWVDFLLPAARADGRVAYNVSVATPAGNRVTALEIAVTTFSAVGNDPRLVPKSSLVLCGGPDNTPCVSPMGVSSADVYSGENTVAASVIARQGLTLDDIHLTYFLVIYMADKPGVALAKQDIQFVIELKL